MISQVNFARPWDMSGSVAGGNNTNNPSVVGNNNNNNSVGIISDHHRLASALGLAPLQVRAASVASLVSASAHVK
jgi:inorganic pyrophosphatase/exopolyphosphatase